MLLLTGPFGSGKTHAVMARLRQRLAEGRTDVRVVVPSTTMAEHLRHALAREGRVLPPDVIQTLSRFAAPWCRELPQISAAALQLLVERVLRQVAPRSFRRVAAYAGFQAAVVEVVDELATSGATAATLRQWRQEGRCDAPFAADLILVLEAVERELVKRGQGLRSQRLQLVARKLRSSLHHDLEAVCFDGFWALTDPELELIDALRQSMDVVITLPDWPGAARTRERLLAQGFPEQHLGESRRRSRRVVVAASTREQEVQEIARRLLAHAGQGRAFRHMGVLVRNRSYVPALRLALDRFGIPARFYQEEHLLEQPVTQYLLRVVDALETDWDHGALLDALAMTPSGLAGTEEGDAFLRAARTLLPNQGLHALCASEPAPAIAALLDRLAQMAEWPALSLTPRQWAERLPLLTSLCAPPPSGDVTSHELTDVWRRRAATLRAFVVAVRETADALPPDEPLFFAEFWRTLRDVLPLSRVQIEDRRRNVVHVLDAYEARQWELPVIFICGLLEGEFPQHQRDEPLLPDEARRQLQDAGLGIRTVADRQQEERLLFEMAVSRATEEMVLTYPRCDRKGDRTLRSFLLDALIEREHLAEPLPSVPVRVLPLRVRVPERVPHVAAAALREQHADLRPTAIEDFLQCRFQFFARHTLDLNEPLLAPEERFGRREQGTLLHALLADWHRHPERDPGALFNERFPAFCSERRIPDGHERERLRLALWRDLQEYVAAQAPEAGWCSLTEVPFTLDIDGVRVSGRIDRYDVDDSGNVRVVDYKFSSDASVRKRVKDQERGRYVQGGLYLLALQQQGLTPAGFSYVALRGGGKPQGWTNEADLRWLMDDARQAVQRLVREVGEGRIDIEPLDADACGHCELRDACRVRAGAPPRTESGTE